MLHNSHPQWCAHLICLPAQCYSIFANLNNRELIRMEIPVTNICVKQITFSRCVCQCMLMKLDSRNTTDMHWKRNLSHILKLKYLTDFEMDASEFTCKMWNIVKRSTTQSIVWAMASNTGFVFSFVLHLLLGLSHIQLFIWKITGKFHLEIIYEQDRF